jgi:hypothetical protein
MASGILASTTFNALTYTSVYGPPADTFSVVTVSIVNKNTNSIFVRLAAAQDPNIPAAGDYLEYQAEILPGGVLERTGVVIQNGRTLYAYSTGPTGATNATASNTDVVVYGIETSTV